MIAELSVVASCLNFMMLGLAGIMLACGKQRGHWRTELWVPNADDMMFLLLSSLVPKAEPEVEPPHATPPAKSLLA